MRNTKQEMVKGMITTTEELFSRMDNSEYLYSHIVERYDEIKKRNANWERGLSLLMNYICVNLEKWVAKPNRLDYVICIGKKVGLDIDRLSRDSLEYEYQNSQIHFPYTKDNYEKLIEHIEEIRGV